MHTKQQRNSQSKSCSNVQLNTIEEDTCDFDEGITRSSLFEQFLNNEQGKEKEDSRGI